MKVDLCHSDVPKNLVSWNVSRIVLYYFEELKSKIERYIDNNNNKRIKQKLASMSPVQYRLDMGTVLVFS
jgi:hypothetical protein